MKNLNTYSFLQLQQAIIAKALEIGAIKINPTDPFTWASGYRMPIYNDNRMLLKFSETRKLVVAGLMRIIECHNIIPDFIEGTVTAGIPWATMLAEELSLALGYIRNEPKDHGLKNQIEGLDATEDFNGANVLVIEDLISTGGSSARAVKAAIDANGFVEYCISLFNYGFPDAQQMFADLTPPCKVESLITYPLLLAEAKAANYLTTNQVIMLEDWSAKPYEWGIKNGFPKETKTIIINQQSKKSGKTNTIS